MKIERRKIDNNQRNRTIRLWITLMSIGIVLIGFIAAGAVKVNTVEENKQKIGNIAKEQKTDREILIRIDERTTSMKEDIDEIKRKVR